MRIPRSQRITSLFPPDKRYSAASKNSFIVAQRPRFRRTGLRILLSSRRRVKFCMLRAPICRMSAYFATTSMWRASITSVTISMSLSSAAFRIILRPFSL